MAKIVIAARLPGRLDEILKGHSLVMPAPGERELPRARLLAEIGDAEGLLALLSLRVDQGLLDAAPRLQIVANYAVGYDNVDVDAARRRGLTVTNTPGVLTEATADLTLALMLAAARRLGEGGALARSGQWHGWEPEQLPAVDLDDAICGIVGLGRIGRAVAERARAFGMRIVYAQPRQALPEVEAALAARWLPLEELLTVADVVTLHCPLSPATRHLIGAAELMRMKPRAVLVNTARGPIVDEAALATALERGHLLAVGLDVFEDEPRIHPGLLNTPRAILMPHLGSSTPRARTRMAEAAAQSLADFFAGRRPAHVVVG
jgi:glyoxylate reductase